MTTSVTHFAIEKRATQGSPLQFVMRNAGAGAIFESRDYTSVLVGVGGTKATMVACFRATQVSPLHLLVVGRLFVGVS